MSYRIVFKGQIGDEFVDDYTGRQLAKDFESNTFPERISINGNVYDAKSVKAVMSGFASPDTNDRNEATKKMIRDMQDEADAIKQKKLAQPPEVRCKNTGMAEVIYMGMSGKRVPPDVMQKIIERQHQFFKENPDWAEANPKCYRDLIPRALLIKPTAAPSMAELLQHNVLMFAERTIINS